MIEFQYFDGCPNSEKTLANLKELINDKIIDNQEIKITEITNPEEAEKLNFQGSPTILINGIDIYSGVIPKNSSFSCRYYSIDGKRTGILSKDFIKKKYGMFKNEK